MFGQAKNHNTSDGDVREPLLNASRQDLAEDRIVFSVADDDDDDGSQEDNTALDSRRDFQPDVQLIGPPLKSTIESRETEFELDSDELELDESFSQFDEVQMTPSSTRGQGSMPLLVGLVDTSISRRSLDGPFSLTQGNRRAADIANDVDLEELAAKRIAGGGMLDSVANMANSILGAGIIGLPYAVKQAGFFTGLILLVVLCVVTDWTIRLIVINAKMSGRNSYIGFMHHCFGSSGRAAVSLFQFAFAFGGMCAFGIIIGDTIPHVIRSIFPRLEKAPILSVFTNRQFIIALCTVGVSYPLSLYRNIHKLSRASGLALIGMTIIVISVLIEGPHVTPDLKGDPSKRFTFIQPGVFQAIGVISFAFVCHHNSLLIYGSMRTPTLDRFAKVTHISTFISFIACCTLAISAFVVFTDKTMGNILNNFSRNDTLINVARFCFGLNMFTTLPLELFVCREVIEQFFFSHEVFSLQRHVFFTTTILMASMMVALITCDLGVMLEITGGVSATALAFIFPAACYLKLTPGKWHSRAKLPAVVCVIFGVVVMVISLIIALGKAWTHKGDAKICM